MIFVQLGNLIKHDMKVRLLDSMGKLISEVIVLKGSTLAYFDTQTLYEGVYFVQVSGGEFLRTTKVIVQK